MPELDIEPLLPAFEGEAPCGVDLEYDAAFLALLDGAAQRSSSPLQ